ncbi:MAG: putative molybdenum carrier protein [Planctomycetaceae bacterium]
MTSTGKQMFSPFAHQPTVESPVRIISGGQTGVDRIALDVALELQIPIGGWCPKGRRAEDGVIPNRYPLLETESKKYNTRTKRNIRDSDATLILSTLPLTGGTAMTENIARKREKPFLIVDLNALPDVENVQKWLSENRIAVLNIAGPRADSLKELDAIVRIFLRKLFRQVLFLPTPRD